MPCRDYTDPEPELDFEAILCGVFTVLDRRDVLDLDFVLNEVDWKEVGDQRDRVVEWWKEHKAEDEARREQQRVIDRHRALMQQAVSKLTKEELDALGVPNYIRS